MFGADDLLDVENLFREDQKKVKKRKKAAKATLSFALDDEGGEEEGSGSSTPNLEPNGEKPAKRAKFRKNPNVDTSFLPDREREEAERREREELRQEWIRRQEEMKQEEIEVTYSYWDGSGHRKSVIVSFMFETSAFRARLTIQFLTCTLLPSPASARREMILELSWRNADSSFPSCALLVWTI